MRILSLLLRPLSWLYGLILWIRHWLYDRGLLCSNSFDQPIIRIGNLSLGGTGKTPMTIFIAEYLSDRYNVYILSRGYAGRSRGIQEVRITSLADEVGDEPLMMKNRLPKVHIFVSNDRVAGIRHINTLDPDRKIVLLDDSLQHRALAGGLQVLLSDINRIFCVDYLLPAGRLRDLKSRASQVDIIAVSKLKSLTEDTTKADEAILRYSQAPVYHTSLSSMGIKDYLTDDEAFLNPKVVVVSAIANPYTFYQILQERTIIKKKYEYRDHYQYTEADLNEWLIYCQENGITQILTTEKDAVKMKDFKDILDKAKVAILVLPIQITMAENEMVDFFQKIETYIKTYDIN
jgi:tetraacyldisaccharide 4'-kinase